MTSVTLGSRAKVCSLQGEPEFCTQEPNLEFLGKKKKQKNNHEIIGTPHAASADGIEKASKNAKYWLVVFSSRQGAESVLFCAYRVLQGKCQLRVGWVLGAFWNVLSALLSEDAFLPLC